MNQNNTNFLKNLPPKGTADWFPEEYRVRKYIFDVFRKVCLSFGYEEYLTPTFEKADIYRAKSGEEIGGKQLMVFKDKVEREFALRPEMTPSVIRMVTRIYNNQPKPIRYFSIANFFRNEKPQRGRNREFWQLNYDLFGSTSIYADAEIVKIALEIMLAFLPKDKINDKEYKPFTININDRRLLNHLLQDVIKINKNNLLEVIRILDKKEKISKEELHSQLKNQGLNTTQIKDVEKYLQEGTSLDIFDSKLTESLRKLFEILESQGYGKWIKFSPSLIRGFDYYNGIVYEVHDNNPKNKRSLFGGGRYDGLGQLFGNYNIPAVGVAPGDETIKLFLEDWDLLEAINENKTTTFYIPLIEEQSRDIISNLCNKLRQQGKIVIEGLEKQALSKSLEFANKQKIDKVIIVGSKELKEKKYIEKDMKTGEQNVINL